MLIDLGAENSKKGEGLFDLLRPAQNVTVDISTGFPRASADRQQRRHPQLKIAAISEEFSHTLVSPAAARPEKHLFLYLGSSIRNLLPRKAMNVISRIQVLCGNDGKLMLSLDLFKDRSILDPADDAALGATAARSAYVLNDVKRIV